MGMSAFASCHARIPPAFPHFSSNLHTKGKPLSLNNLHINCIKSFFKKAIGNGRMVMAWKNFISAIIFPWLFHEWTSGSASKSAFELVIWNMAFYERRYKFNDSYSLCFIRISSTVIYKSRYCWWREVTTLQTSHCKVADFTILNARKVANLSIF